MTFDLAQNIQRVRLLKDSLTVLSVTGERKRGAGGGGRGEEHHFQHVCPRTETPFYDSAAKLCESLPGIQVL